MERPFDSIYRHGFVRAAVCIPHVRVADPARNVDRIVAMARRASDKSAAVALFPELCVSAYSSEDLFHQDALLDACLEALRHIVEESRSLAPVLFVGAPLRFEGKLFNCAVAIHRGRVLGVTPKTYLPNYREYYEKRQFTPASHAARGEVQLLDERVPFGSDLIYEAAGWKDFALHAEICEDLWAPIPPSTRAALAGATILVNLSASNITIAKAEYRRRLCASQSGRCVAAYLYAAAGPGESTTDLAWDGHGLIYENDDLLAESKRFAGEEQVIFADIDLERLAQDRMRTTCFGDAVREHLEEVRRVRRVGFEFQAPEGKVLLERNVERFPYVPSDPSKQGERCYEAYNIQVHGLLTRLESTGIQRAVLGISGGLDSTHALLVTAKTMDRLGLPRKNIIACTMPGFATSDRTRRNALGLMSALGVTAQEIDIRPSCRQMLQDIGHPFSKGQAVYDVTFENVQAGERASHLFRLANFLGGIVVGTGDLSEIALGWCTYGVGDQMSHYNVNASVPKTLIQYLIRWVIASKEFPPETSAILQSILDTEISPELIPGEGTEKGQPGQATEDIIGPYELQDFNLYYISRFGFRPSKVAFLAHHAWGDKARGSWPSGLPPEKQNAYDLGAIKKWLEVFLVRFFKSSQFKRSALPNGPKVGSGGSLSPRGDWRAPSDSDATVWLDELRRGIPG
jgi:NAD+ synthase (glutamine-hydrolysing)